MRKLGDKKGNKVIKLTRNKRGKIRSCKTDNAKIFRYVKCLFKILEQYFFFLLGH